MLGRALALALPPSDAVGSGGAAAADETTPFDSDAAPREPAMKGSVLHGCGTFQLLKKVIFYHWRYDCD